MKKVIFLSLLVALSLSTFAAAYTASKYMTFNGYQDGIYSGEVEFPARPYIYGLHFYNIYAYISTSHGDIISEGWIVRDAYALPNSYVYDKWNDHTKRNYDGNYSGSTDAWDGIKYKFTVNCNGIGSAHLNARIYW